MSDTSSTICISILINESNTILSIGLPGESDIPLIQVVESLTLPPEIETLVTQFREELPTRLEKIKQRQEAKTASNSRQKRRVEAPSLDHSPSDNHYQQMNLLEGLS